MKTKKNGYKELSPKQEEFCQQWFVHHFNATKSAKAAGLAHPAVYGHNLLRQPQIQKRIAEIDAERLGKRNLDADTFIERLYYLVTRTAHDFHDDKGRVLKPHKLSKGAAACVDGVEQTEFIHPRSGAITRTIKYKLSPILPALDLLAKHKGLIASVKHTVDGEVKLVLDYEKLYKDANGDQKTVYMSNVDYLITHPEAVEPPPTELNGDEHLYKTDELIELDEDE